MNAQQMISALLPTRDADAGTACMSCMKSPSNLVRCSACRLVKYCDKSCQIRDWKRRHKPVCKILRAFTATSRRMVDGVAVDPLLARGKHNLADKFNRFKLEAFFSDLSDDLPMDGADVSWELARKIVERSRCCSVCQRTDFDYQGDDAQPRDGVVDEWRCCPRCRQGWCCSQKHYDEYVSSNKHTIEICDAYVQANNVARFQYDHTVNHGDRFLAVPQQPLSQSMTTFPTCWEDYFQTRMPTEYSMKNRLPAEFFPASTFPLTQVTTTLYGMYQHDPEFFTAKEREVLTIHVLGPSVNLEYDGGAPTMVWEEIMHCLPYVKRMNVVFVGPEGKLSMPLTPIQTCPDCTSKGRVRTTGCYQLTYHDYHKTKDFVEPDFVVAFNTGMFEEYTSSWKESLNVLLDLNVPCIFTSYDEHEGTADLNVLREVHARTDRKSVV